MSKLRIYSGECCMCDIGVPVGAKDFNDRDLHTGDIVIIYQESYIGTEFESWIQHGMTAVVSDQYKSFSDGSIKEKQGKPVPYVMGIYGCGFDDSEWQIHIIKKYTDVIDGEHWKEFEFNYKADGKGE